MSCPYLNYKESKSCASCTGYVCRAYGREKKLSDTAPCKGAYAECPRYVDAIKNAPPAIPAALGSLVAEVEAQPTFTTSNAEPIKELVVNVTPPPEPPRQAFVRNPCGCREDIRLSRCPYQSTRIPAGESTCTGVWCYANNKPVRVPKNCWHFDICTVYLMSKYKGVPFPEVK